MYMKEPSEGRSVTLTFLSISFILLAGFSVAASLGYVNSVDTLSELFYACAALYFGRRVKVGTKSFQVEQEPKDENR